jgi:tRNA A37 N6-isopentenylltransferase MiaA
MRDLTKAIISLYPTAQWELNGDEYSGLVWRSNETPKPTEQELLDECDRLQAEYEAKEYQRQRASEYPDFKDYLDGIVKGDQAQIQAYIDACNAVKNKYPKGQV